MSVPKGVYVLDDDTYFVTYLLQVFSLEEKNGDGETVFKS